MKKRITIHTENSIYVLDPDEVMYCYCKDTSTTIHLKNDETVEISKNMAAVEKLVEGCGFIRPHNAYLVNTNYILRVDMAEDYNLVLTNHTKIPIKGKTQAEILEIIKISN